MGYCFASRFNDEGIVLRRASYPPLLTPMTRFFEISSFRVVEAGCAVTLFSCLSCMGRHLGMCDRGNSSSDSDAKKTLERDLDRTFVTTRNYSQLQPQRMRRGHFNVIMSGRNDRIMFSSYAIRRLHIELCCMRPSTCSNPTGKMRKKLQRQLVIVKQAAG